MRRGSLIALSSNQQAWKSGCVLCVQSPGPFWPPLPVLACTCCAQTQARVTHEPSAQLQGLTVVRPAEALRTHSTRLRASAG